MALDLNVLQETLKAQFFSDAQDLVDEMNLEANRIQKDWQTGLGAMMRLTHNLKGAAQLSGFREFGFMVHQFESVCEELKSTVIDDSNDNITRLCIKRICAIIRKNFEGLKSSITVGSIEQANWHTAFRMLCVVSLKKEQKMVDAKKVVSSPVLDDWGLNEVAKDPGLESTPAVAPLKDSAQDPAFSQSRQVESNHESSFQKGWGIFEQTSSPSSVHVSSISSESSPKESGYDFSKGWGLFEEPDLAMMSPKSVSFEKKEGGNTIDQINSTIIERQQKVKEVSTRQSYLICTNNGAEFAFPVRYVQEILPNRPHKLLPISRKGVAGVISFRGQIMAILKMFDKDVDDKGESGRCIVVCQINKKQFGFRIDTVVSVLDIDEKILQAIPGVVDDDALVRSLAQIDGKTVSFVDPNMAI